MTRIDKMYRYRYSVELEAEVDRSFMTNLMKIEGCIAVGQIKMPPMLLIETEREFKLNKLQVYIRYYAHQRINVKDVYFDDELWKRVAVLEGCPGKLDREKFMQALRARFGSGAIDHILQGCSGTCER